MGAFSFDPAAVATPVDDAQEEIDKYSNTIAAAYPASAPPLPGWVRGYEFHVLVGLALLIVLRLLWMKTGAKSKDADLKLQELKKTKDASYPYFTACLASLVILGNILVLAGVVSALGNFETMTQQIAASADAVDATSQGYSSQIRQAQAAYNTYSSTAHAAIDITLSRWEDSYDRFFKEFVPAASPANTTGHAATATAAKATLEADAPFALNTLHSIFVSTEQVGKGIVGKLVREQRPVCAAMEVEMQSVQSALDELAKANALFGTIAKLASKDCISAKATNCSVGELKLAAATTRLPEISFGFFGGLESVSALMEQLGLHYRGWKQGYAMEPPENDWCRKGYRVQCARVLWNTPKDVFFTALAMGASDFVAGSFGPLPQQGRNKFTMEKHLTDMNQMTNYHLQRSPIRQIYRNVKNMLLYNNDTIAQQSGGVARGFEDALSYITYARKACAATKSHAIKTGQEFQDHLYWPTISIGLYGMLVAVQVLAWAIATRFPDKGGFAACLNSYFAFLSYSFLYLLLDFFVLISFFFIFGAMAVASRHATMVSVCGELGNGFSRSALSSNVCDTINGELATDVQVAAAGIFLNFIASYHLLVALQGTHSRFVSGAKDKEAAVAEAVSGRASGAEEDAISETSRAKKFIL